MRSTRIKPVFAGTYTTSGGELERACGHALAKQSTRNLKAKRLRVLALGALAPAILGSRCGLPGKILRKSPGWPVRVFFLEPIRTK